MSLGGEIKKEKKEEEERVGRRGGKKEKMKSVDRARFLNRIVSVNYRTYAKHRVKRSNLKETNFIFIEDDQRNRRHLSNVFDILEIFPDY